MGKEYAEGSMKNINLIYNKFYNSRLLFRESSHGPCLVRFEFTNLLVFLLTDIC